MKYTHVISLIFGSVVSLVTLASAQVPADPPSSPAGMILIPAGDFAMGRQSGSGYGDELPVHTVTVGAFYLDKYEVSKALWDEVKAYADGIGYNFSNSGSGVGDNQPVNQVNWYDCVKWCNACLLYTSPSPRDS